MGTESGVARMRHTAPLIFCAANVSYSLINVADPAGTVKTPFVKEASP